MGFPWESVALRWSDLNGEDLMRRAKHDFRRSNFSDDELTQRAERFKCRVCLFDDFQLGDMQSTKWQHYFFRACDLKTVRGDSFILMANCAVPLSLAWTCHYILTGDEFVFDCLSRLCNCGVRMTKQTGSVSPIIEELVHDERRNKYAQALLEMSDIERSSVRSQKFIV